MSAAIDETTSRREKQRAFNEEHGIVPKTVIKSVRDLLEISKREAPAPADGIKLTKRELEEEIKRLEKEMAAAAKLLEFEYAAALRDRIIELRGGS
jgi:excinuclease ABC subunit B